MPEKSLPIPENELDRVLNLADLDLDYATLQNKFKGLASLAAKITGTSISLINLIDSFTQWTIANHGLPITQMPREDSVCQYTIVNDNYFEVPNLSLDERFKDKDYVTGPLKMKYYMGVPLTTPEGLNIGALCVLDTEFKLLQEDKLELLKIIAEEIVSQLQTLKTIERLRSRLTEARDAQKTLAHALRSPIAGIVGLTGLINEQGTSNELDEVMESISMIHKSGETVLDLTNEILAEHKEQPVKSEEFNQEIFKAKLEQLYVSQAREKDIDFKVTINEKTKDVPFSKNKLLQIAGNLIYNAIKFTPRKGTIDVELDLKAEATYNMLHIKLTDHDLTPEVVGDDIDDEKGFAFGLSLVRRLIENLKGELMIRADKEHGATFEILIHQTYQ